MSTAFSDRLRAGDISAADELAEAWLGPIREWIDDLTAKDMPGLVRICFNRGDDEAEAQVREVVNAVGERIVASDEHQLTSLLTTQIVIDSYDRVGGDDATALALLIRSAEFQGWTPAHPDVLSHTQEHIRWAASAAYRVPQPPRQVQQTAAAREAIEELVTADWEVYRRAVVELSSELARTRRALARVVSYIGEAQRPLMEQAELSWWIDTGYSLSADVTYAELVRDALPIVIGADLARMAPRAPGPLAIDALIAAMLDRSGVDLARPVSIHAAVSAAEVGKLSELNESNRRVEDFTPTILETHNNRDVVATPARLARQVYDEWLIVNHEF